jgi:hypothetical protein
MWTPIIAAIKGDDNSNGSDLDSSLELVLETLIDRGADSILDLQDEEGQMCLHIFANALVETKESGPQKCNSSTVPAASLRIQSKTPL